MKLMKKLQNTRVTAKLQFCIEAKRTVGKMVLISNLIIAFASLASFPFDMKTSMLLLGEACAMHVSPPKPYVLPVVLPNDASHINRHNPMTSCPSTLLQYPAESCHPVRSPKRAILEKHPIHAPLVNLSTSQCQVTNAAGARAR